MKAEPGWHDLSVRRRFTCVNASHRDGLVNLGQPTNPQNSACVLFAVLPPKNSNSTGAKVFSVQRFAFAKQHFRPTMRRKSLWPQEKLRNRHPAVPLLVSRRHSGQRLTNCAGTRADDLLKAAEWWRLHQTIVEFVSACEQRWRDSQNGSLTSEQEAWLTWARENAKAMSPFETGYPDAAKDGPFDATAIPFGGPYPAKRDFPRPPTMPKIPPPVVQQSGYPSAHIPDPKPYPFWLKYQGR
jgi:hypothetical protein